MIRPVDEIPKNIQEKRKSYREQIRNDIREAIDKGIGKFEFVGDYKYKYLAQYAREEADKIVWDMARDYVHRIPGDETVYIGSYDVKTMDAQPIKITSYKEDKEAEPRVFCEICFCGFEQELDDIVALKLEVRKERNEHRKLKMKANDETETIEAVPE